MALVKEETRLHNLLFNDADGLISNFDQPAPDSDDEEPEEKKIKRNETEAWHDEDDDNIRVKDALEAQGRNLPDGGINSHDGKYAKLVQEKFKLIVGTPKWAEIRQTCDEDSDEELLKDYGYTTKARSKTILPKDILAFKKVTNLNNTTKREGPIIKAIDFHPTSTVALVAGMAGIMSIVAVDGKKNEKLHSVAFRKYPIHGGCFTKDGKRAYLGSIVSHFFSYDLIEAKSTRVKLPNGITKMTDFKLSPCGKYLAIVGRFGEIHLLCAESWELIQTLKQTTHVTALEFDSKGEKLFAHGMEGQLTVWDISSRRACHKFVDDGCIAGSEVAVSPCNGYLATGSRQGVVNLYEMSDVLKTNSPSPLKTYFNLTTSISSIKFNPTSEIMYFASVEKANSMKIVHMSSNTVFSNFPGNTFDHGHCSIANFSPNGGYLAVGSNKRLAYLFRLKHYKEY